MSNTKENKVGRLELVIGPMFSGKCHGKYTPILLYNGQVKYVQNIIKGDELMSPHSTKKVVKSTTRGMGMLYRVIQEDAMAYVVNDEHILCLISPEGNIVKISVNEYIKGDYEDLLGFMSIPDFDPSFSRESSYSNYDLGSTSSNIYESLLIEPLKKRREWLAGFLEKTSSFDEKTQSFKFRDERLNKSLFKKLVRGVGLKVKIYSFNFQVFGTMIKCLPFNRIFGQIIKRDINKFDLCTKIKIEKIGMGEYFGFTVDDSTEGGAMYMLEDYTITHNTSEVLRRVSRDISVWRNVLFINHLSDSRSEKNFSTHNPFFQKDISVEKRGYEKLPNHEIVKNYDTIVIDESQFFDDLNEIKKYVEINKQKVIVSGLNADSDKNKFGKITDLISWCDQLDLKTALCVECSKEGLSVEAPFTKCSITKNGQTEIGGSDKYSAVCRKHHM